MIQKPRGTFDIMPEETPIWQFIEATARNTAARYGYKEIRTPTFEATELFQRGVGDTTDVVQKEMYTFTDRENRSFTLRPEGTASVARALIENGRCSDTLPLKLYYMINCFRYEKPQAGRSREFYQFGVEMYGAADAAADADTIGVANSIIRNLGITDVSLHINSIGCPNCRPAYRLELYNYFKAHEDELCDTCKSRLETNPLRILDCKSPICSKIAEGAPKSIDHLCPECAEHMDKLKNHLDEMGIEYEIDTNIVRGLDYYTRTVFEFICTAIGAQSTVCGGGRYDGLMKELGGPQMPGIGFAMGITRLILAMKACNAIPDTDNFPSLYIAPMGAAAQCKAAGIVSKLRSLGVYAEYDLVGRSLKAQMKYADKTGAFFTLIIGDSELESGKAILKNMKESSQQEIDFNDIKSLMQAIGYEV
ncbi:MAG: histidine--tRNA ligase [Ruminococcaceae bacterium]|nr:histidine--tRNA ligase [Oscillospiraceae bacterium]